MSIFVLKRKYYSMLVDNVEESYLKTPENLKDLPEIIQKYYRSGLNKDFLKLIRLQNCHEFNPFPVPVLDGSVEKDEYTPVFAKDQDLKDLGSYKIYVDSNNNLVEKSGMFFKKFTPINKEKFKDFLLETLKYENFGEDWSEHVNGDKIISLENIIRKKIVNL